MEKQRVSELPSWAIQQSRSIQNELRLLEYLDSLETSYDLQREFASEETDDEEDNGDTDGAEDDDEV